VSLNARRSIHAQTGALLLLLSLVIPASGQADPRDVAVTRATALSKVDINNFGQVNPSYFRGGEPDGDDYADLAALGIRTLVDLRGDDADAREKLLVGRAGMNYVNIPMSTRERPSAAKVEEFLRVVNDPVNQPVYVHCVEGRHRTGVMTAVYRITRDGWTADQAFKEMKEYHFGPAFLHTALKKFVYEYERTRSAVVNAGQ
jgi:protein tyrosine/serine phosphatase